MKEKMKVFVLMYHGAYDGEVSSSVMVFDSLDKAQKRMRTEYEESVGYIKENFGEEARYEWTDMSCCTYQEGYFCHNHDEWNISEVDVL